MSDGIIRTPVCEMARDSCDFRYGHEDRAAEATVMRAGASGFFMKPLDNEKFIAAVQDALKPRD